jgi:two-component system, NtrC family, sensor histidine kinase HydH
MTNSEGRPPRGGARARAGWLATTLILAAALVASSWTNYRAARAAVQALNLGQAEMLGNAVRSAEFQAAFEGIENPLDSILVAQAEAGLRFIAVLEPGGEVVSSAGEPAGPVTWPQQLQPGERFNLPLMVPQGNRIRAFHGRGGGGPFQFRQPFPRPEGAEVWAAGRDTLTFAPGSDPRVATRQAPPREPATFGRGGGGAGGPGGRLTMYVLEFEPVASEVVAQAVRGLILNGIGGGVLTLLALVFWQGSLRNEAAQKQIEQQKRLSQLGEMSAVLAHEIRNPLASLKGNAQLLAEGLEAGTRERRRADRVVGEAIRLETLTSDLLDFARSAPPSRLPTDPAELLRQAIQDVAPGEIRVEASAAPRIWPLDRTRMRQALSNLLRNAWQISPAGRPPVATVTQLGGNLVFMVRDFGPGIQPAELKRIFEPFYTTRTQGTGLGLPVARRAVELHGGTIEAENHPEGGAVFRITIPTGAS